MRQSVLNQKVNYIWDRVLHWKLTFRFSVFLLFLFFRPLSFFCTRYKRPDPDRVACLFLDKLQAQTLAYYFFVFSQEVPGCIISKHHQTRLGATKDFIFPEVSAPRSFPPATKECLFFLKLDGFNCCGTTAKQPPPHAHHTLHTHEHTLMHKKSKIRLANYANSQLFNHGDMFTEGVDVFPFASS